MRVLAVAMCAALPAHATDIDPLDPSVSVAHDAGSPSVESPLITGKGITFGVLGHIAKDLVMQAGPDGEAIPSVPQVFATTLYGGWTVNERFRVDVRLPLYWHTRVLSYEGNGSFSNYSGANTSDMFVQANYQVYKNPDETFYVSALPGLAVPTGGKRAFLAKGGQLNLKGAIGGTFQDDFGYAANLGWTLQGRSVFQGVAVGSAVRTGGAAWWRPRDRMRVGLESDFSIGTTARDGFRNVLGTAGVFTQVTNDQGIGVTLGASRALVVGVGAPRYRITAAITYAKLVMDSDEDTLLDPYDACPKDPEDFDEFEDGDGCPEIDNDQDAILDIDDACANEPEDFDGFEDTDGCPEADNDQDGLADGVDACPLQAGNADLAGCPDADLDKLVDRAPPADWDGWAAVVEAGYEGPVPPELDQCPAFSGPQALAGCPDRDEDDIPDFRDACPDEARSAESDAETSNGCPSVAFVQGDRITITDRVKFQTGKDIIRPESFDLLNTVAAVINDNPQLLSLEIAGHTDNVGSSRTNQRLSERRAKSVMTYLTNRGVTSERLSAKGYGEEEPVDVNFTESGRQANRRVEFRILEVEERDPNAEITLGSDTASISVLLPMPYSDLYVDGVIQAARAPVHNLIVIPGDHVVRIADPQRGIDIERPITAVAGETAVLDLNDLADAGGATEQDAGEPDSPSTPTADTQPANNLTPEQTEPSEAAGESEAPAESAPSVPAEEEPEGQDTAGQPPTPTDSEPSEAADTPPEANGETEASPWVTESPTGESAPEVTPSAESPTDVAPGAEGESDAPWGASSVPEPETDADTFPVDSPDDTVTPADDVEGSEPENSSDADAPPPAPDAAPSPFGPGFNTDVNEDPKAAAKAAKAEAKRIKREQRDAEKSRKAAEKAKARGDAPDPIIDPFATPD